MALSYAKKAELIVKHAKKFASKDNTRPVLCGVHYDKDGSAVMTDRYRLLRIKDAHNYGRTFTSDVKTGAEIDGTYPDTSKIFPTEFKTEITLIETGKLTNVKDAIARVKLAVDTAKLSGDKSHVARLEYVGSSVTLSVTSDNPIVSFSAGISASISGPDESIAFNAEYMLDALNVFKDARSQRVIIGLNGSMSPIVLRDEENGIDAIVLPIRTPSV